MYFLDSIKSLFKKNCNSISFIKSKLFEKKLHEYDIHLFIFIHKSFEFILKI